jgi:hypothetical protein
MPKQPTLRGRISPILKARLQAYIESENSRGRSVDESGIVRDAVVEYLDRRDGRLAAQSSGAELNDRPQNTSSGSHGSEDPPLGPYFRGPKKTPPPK